MQFLAIKPRLIPSPSIWLKCRRSWEAKERAWGTKVLFAESFAANSVLKPRNQRTWKFHPLYAPFLTSISLAIFELFAVIFFWTPIFSEFSLQLLLCYSFADHEPQNCASDFLSSLSCPFKFFCERALSFLAQLLAIWGKWRIAWKGQKLWPRGERNSHQRRY